MLARTKRVMETPRVAERRLSIMNTRRLWGEQNGSERRVDGVSHQGILKDEEGVASMNRTAPLSVWFLAIGVKGRVQLERSKKEKA